MAMTTLQEPVAMSSCRFSCQGSTYYDPIVSMSIPRQPSFGETSSCEFSDVDSEMLYSTKSESPPSSEQGRTMKRSRGKSTYKHIPHREKPPHLVARRNARERRRVQAVNSAFLRLRKHVPHENKHKRLSKVKTLKIAIDYIHQLQDLIDDYDSSVREAVSYNYNNQRVMEQQVCGMRDQISYKENQWITMNQNRTRPRESSCAMVSNSGVHLNTYGQLYHG